eukprot:jgi/Mesvir1/6870/Mv09039-RA.1
MSNQAGNNAGAADQDSSPRSQRANDSGDENDNPDTSSLGAFLRQLILPRTPKHQRGYRRRNSGEHYSDSDREGHESGEDEVLVSRQRDSFDGVEQSGSPTAASHSLRAGTVGSLNIPDVVPGKVVATTAKPPARSQSARSWWGGSTDKKEKEKEKEKEKGKEVERDREKEQERERARQREKEEKEGGKHKDKDKSKKDKDKMDKTDKDKKKKGEGDERSDEENRHHQHHHHLHNPFHHHHHHHKKGEGQAPATGAQTSLMDVDFFGPSFAAESQAQLGGAGTNAPVLVGAAGDMLFDLMFTQPPTTAAGGQVDASPPTAAGAMQAPAAGTSGAAAASSAGNRTSDGSTPGASRKGTAMASPSAGPVPADAPALPSLDETAVAAAAAAAAAATTAAAAVSTPRLSGSASASVSRAGSVSTHSLSMRRSLPFGGVDASAPVLLQPSNLLSEDATHALSHWLPTLCWGKPWRLLYSTEKHGISLKTLYRKADGPTILVVRDTAGGIFGGFASETWEVSFKYTGTNDCFVFRINPGPITVFPSTVANRYYMLCREDSLAFGGGGHFALRIDEELYVVYCRM